MSAAAHLPVAGICGYSSSGKTSLITELIPRFVEKGLRVAVVKHDAHRLDIDRPGKDSDLFFRAGATVFAHDSAQSFLRIPGRGEPALVLALELLLRDHDIVLVEGHRQTPLPFKIWLRSPSNDEPPPEGASFHAELEPGPERTDRAFGILWEWLHGIVMQTPLRAGILLGGQSSRMGRPKHLLEFQGKTWLERQAGILSSVIEPVCLLGAGEVPSPLRELPQIPDAPGRAGPVAGMLAAMQWDPSADWFFVGCDMPLITPEAVRWLLAQRAPGLWAVMPGRHPEGQAEPLFAWYSHRAASLLSQTDRPVALAGHPKIATVTMPEDLAIALSGFNTPEEVISALRSLPLQ